MRAGGAWCGLMDIVGGRCVVVVDGCCWRAVHRVGFSAICGSCSAFSHTEEDFAEKMMGFLQVVEVVFCFFTSVG